MTEPLLRTLNLSKRFSGLSALEGVSFTLEAGEILGVVGRRGSGKSTLLHLLAGLDTPSTGEIHIDQRRVSLHDPIAAQRHGIQLIHQKPLLVERLDVIQNIFLGHERRWPLGVPDWRQMTPRAQALLADFDMPAQLLNEKIVNLSDEQRQVIAILHVLCHTARLILLDDSLEALSFQRQQLMLGRLKALARQDVAVIISSDNLKHLFAVTDRIIVLYEGRLVADRRTADSTPREIVELIVGASRQTEVTPIMWALENYHKAQQQAEELSRMQATLRDSLEAQDSLNRQLVERLHQQLLALDQLNLALQAAHRRLLTEREEERKYLARELHDQVIQDLLSFNYALEEAEGDEPEATHREELSAIRGGIRQVVSDLRQMCSDLRPPTIDSHGLAAAIRSHAQEWADRNDITLHLQIDPELGRLPEAIELSIFRIVQEGLSNIRKHAQARKARLCLERTQASTLRLRLEDDGQGVVEPPDLAAQSAQKHFGLLGISERVALLGGGMHIESQPRGGLALQIEIPSPYPSVLE